MVIPTEWFAKRLKPPHATSVRIEDTAYAAIDFPQSSRFLSRLRRTRVGVLNGTYHQARSPQDIPDVIETLHETAERSEAKKVVAAGVKGANGNSFRLATELWLANDTVPVFVDGKRQKTVEIAETVSHQFEPNGLPKIIWGPHNEVIPSDLVSLDVYKRAYPEAFEQIEWLVPKLRDKRIIFLNSTPQGGGVALMRHALVRFGRQLGLDMHWHTLEPDMSIFDITKQKFHNTLQGVANERLTPEDKELISNWSHRNAEMLRPVLEHADFVVIDDYQPSGLIADIKGYNPDVRIAYRNHIQTRAPLINTPGSAQEGAFRQIWYGDGGKNSGAQAADIVLCHPVPEFVPDMMPKERVLFMPATTDPFDGLNKPLTKDQLNFYLAEVDKLLIATSQQPIDHARPYITQVARFDPSKGYPELLEAFRIAHKRMRDEGRTDLPQLVLAGHGAQDDPDGDRIHAQLMGILQLDLFADVRQDVKILRVPHKDQLLNAIVTAADIGVQNSLYEGCEVKVTELLMHGKPVLGAKRGGIPGQIVDGESGFLVEPTNSEEVAGRIYQLLTDRNLYAHMSRQAEALAKKEYTTAYNMANWLYVFNELQQLPQGKKYTNGNFDMVSDRSRQAYDAAQAIK